MMIPAIMTPRETDNAVVLMPMSRKLAARVPVHAPVPGMGMPTNSISATNSPPRPAFIRAPVQHLPGEEIDQRHRQHIAHDAHRKRRPVVQIHAHGHNDTAPQLHQRHHGHEENQKIFGKHSITLM